MNACPQCSKEIQPDWKFCPYCGKALIEIPLSTSIGKQILIYSISFFLAPLGLGWGLKYIRRKTTKEKIVGWVAIILTILAVLLIILSVAQVMKTYSNILNSLGNGTFNGSLNGY